MGIYKALWPGEVVSEPWLGWVGLGWVWLVVGLFFS